MSEFKIACLVDDADTATALFDPANGYVYLTVFNEDAEGERHTEASITTTPEHILEMAEWVKRVTKENGMTHSANLHPSSDTAEL